jgi:hypothetical protein
MMVRGESRSRVTQVLSEQEIRDAAETLMNNAG